jgi:CubicO group peptidase (beta-lactamase class C family)
MIRLALLSLLLSIAAVTVAAAQHDLPSARIDSVFLDMNRSDRPGCTLGVFSGGEVAYANGYGMANLEYGIALQPRSVFHIASISKQFTAFAVELLVSEGKVSWDDDIRSYVPEIPEYGQPITLRHLVHHMSGIRDQWNLLFMAGWRWEADLVTQANVLDVLSRQTALNFEPGAEYLYSNSGFTLLAVVVERVSGKTLREFTEERIFVPLGMTSTHFHDDHETIVPDRAYGYRHYDDEGWKISIPDFAIVGASSLFTTVEDMAKWDRNLRDHVLGDDALYERFLDRGILNDGDTLTYAHGITVSDYRGLTAIGHSGGDAGYRTNYLRFPTQDVGIVSFCNFARANPGAYVRQVADILLEDALEPNPEDEAPPEIDTARWGPTFEAMSGFYRDPLTDTPLHVWTHEGKARVTQGFGRDSSGLLLIPEGNDRYSLWPGEETVTVELQNGQPEAIQSPTRRYVFVGPAVSGVDATDYAGLYWSDELGTEYRVEADTANAGGIALFHRTQDTDRFRPAFRDGFRSGGDWLTFVRDRRGRVTGFTWSNGRVRKVAFSRR